MSGEKFAGQMDVVSVIQRGGVVPVVRLPSLEQAAPLVQALLAGGVTAVELTMTSPGALDALPRLLEAIPAFRTGEAVLGMGTVVTRQQAAAAMDAGAQFIVSPILDLDVVGCCVERGVPVMPGALTPTEIQAAWRAGAPVVKVFPARAVGPAYFKDLLAPLPHLRLMPTGGVNLDNAAAFIRNGAVAIGVGGALVAKDLVSAQAWDELTERATQFVDAVRAARASTQRGAP